MKKLIKMMVSIVLACVAGVVPVSAFDEPITQPYGNDMPWFHIVDRVAVDNDNLRVMVDSGAVITISGIVPVTTSEGQSVDRSQITEGSKLLVWHEALPPSYPAQATASRVVLFARD